MATSDPNNQQHEIDSLIRHRVNRQRKERRGYYAEEVMVLRVIEWLAAAQRNETRRIQHKIWTLHPEGKHFRALTQNSRIKVAYI